MNWNKNWKKSGKPTKKRKYARNAPEHVTRKLMSAHLSKPLAQKHGTRSFPPRKGDKIKIMIGDFKGTTGKIEKVLYKKRKVLIDKIKISKKDGTKTSRPIDPSNLMIIELNLEDKKRSRAIERRKK
ncbi:MAG: 50S ribosomal protein L24 [Nanoarchaeota archaeon]|nr:50S ribosomal protein L24 [Nanoarchaeota archaeon]